LLSAKKSCGKQFIVALRSLYHRTEFAATSGSDMRNACSSLETSAVAQVFVLLQNIC